MKSNLEWEAWARHDPLWAVASWEGRQRGAPGEWTLEEFHAVGASDWDDYVRQWQSYGLDPRCCLEIGCGAGRLTRALATSFDEVFAVDVSEEMVARARESVPDVTFLVSDGLTLPLADRSVSAVFSAFVFQHFDSLHEAELVWHEVGRVLEPGGTFMIQLPLHSWPGMPRFYRNVYRVHKLAGDVRARLRRWRLRHGGPPFWRHLSHENASMLAMLDALGFEDVEIRAFRVRSNSSFDTFVLARRARS